MCVCVSVRVSGGVRVVRIQFCVYVWLEREGGAHVSVCVHAHARAQECVWVCVGVCAYVHVRGCVCACV